MPFRNRWLIEGVLVTQSPLHVGDGTTTKRDDLVDESDAQRPVKVPAVATDHTGRAHIPGGAIKGNLRAWTRGNLYSSSPGLQVPLGVIDAVFGTESQDAEDAVGGKVEFQDAFVIDPPVGPLEVPYWHPQRLTGVAASVAIDRITRTATHGKLIHREFVPPGIRFHCTITGQDLGPDELDLLLVALQGFNDPQNPVTIGSDTGDGQGRLAWSLQSLARLAKDDVAAWLRSPGLGVGYAALVPVKEVERDQIAARAASRYQVASSSSITIYLAIHFEGPFLVNDPSRTKKGRRSPADGIPAHAPLRNHEGRVVLPGRSIRGALRSQAEKIVRTLNRDAACLVTDSGAACVPIYQADARETDLCLTCQVFGAPGWRAPVQFSDFVPVPGSQETLFHQEFVAIDRWTGGGAGGLKFDALSVYRPVLTGRMTVDVSRIDPWALGLLALTLRDLMEGDIPLGFGAARGYGACIANIERVTVSSLDSLIRYKKLLDDNGLTVLDLNSLNTTSPPDVPVQTALIDLVTAFQEQVSSFRKNFPAKSDNEEADVAVL